VRRVDERIFQHPTMAGTIILMLTSDNRAGHVARGRELGEAAHLVKPVKRAELLEAIQEACAGAAPLVEQPAAQPGDVLEGAQRLRVLLAEEKIRHVSIPSRTSSELNLKLWLGAFPRLLKEIRREKPDLIHSHTRVTQVLGWAVSSLLRVPYVTTCHGLYKFRLGRRFFRCWGSWVMAISNATMNRVVQQYRLAPPHQVILVENGIDVDRFRQAPPQVDLFQYRLGANRDFGIFSFRGLGEFLQVGAAESLPAFDQPPRRALAHLRAVIAKTPQKLIRRRILADQDAKPERVVNEGHLYK
jgi:glycosyltransferase involved in cell wall biosynthesis